MTVMADRRISQAVISGTSGQVILDATKDPAPFSQTQILDKDGNVLLDLTKSGPKLPQANQGGPAGSLSAYPLVIGTDVPHDTAAGVGAVAAGSGVVSALAGTYANRPAYGTTGRFYFATDYGTWSYDTGTAWVELNQLAGSLTFPNGEGLTSIAGAKFATGTGGGGWQFWPSAATNYAITLHGLTGQSAYYLAILDVNSNILAYIDQNGVIGSAIADGTAPLSVTSKTVVPNLNSERWGGAKNDIQYAVTTSSMGVSSPIQNDNYSTGLGVAITPSTNKVLILFYGSVFNATAGGTTRIDVLKNTSGIPPAGTLVTDGSASQESWVFANNSIASGYVPVAMTVLDPNVTAGQTTYYYVSISQEAASGEVGFQFGQIICLSK